MLEIINQEIELREGNDCLIENCYVIFKCHGKYLVMNIRRYRGWCDNGLDILGRKEFADVIAATEYYNGDLRNL